MTSREEERRAEVLRLHVTEGKGIRAIARELHMARNTVRLIIGRRQRAPATARPRVHMLQPFEASMRQLLVENPDIRGSTMLERLRGHGYTGGITIVRDWLARERPRVVQREAFLTLQFAPGEAAQVDWADFGFALNGCPRRVSCFVMVLCYSRQMYLEFTLSQALPSLLRCMEHALGFFGGSTRVDIFDNMKTVVSMRAGGKPQFNRRFLDYAAARGFSITACNPERGNEKGRVERPIGFIRERFWPGRKFASLLELNMQAARWRDEYANNRIHDVTGKVPGLVWEHEERAALRPLPATPYPTDDLETTTVTKTFRVAFDRNTYSVPHRLVGQLVTIRGTESAVHIYLGPKLVAEHARSWMARVDVEDPSHKEGLLARKPRALLNGLPGELSDLGECGVEYFKILRATTRSLVSEIRRLTYLTEMFSAQATVTAMKEVMATGHVGAEYVEHVLRHAHRSQPPTPPLRLGQPALDDIRLSAPDLSIYDQVTRRTADPHDHTPAELEEQTDG